MSLLSPLPLPILLLLLPLGAQGGSPSPPGEMGLHGHLTAEDMLRGVAQKQMEEELVQSSSNTSNSSSPISFAFTDQSSGELMARLGLDLPVNVDLASTMCQGEVVDGKCCNGKGDSKCDAPGRVVVNMTSIVNFKLSGEGIPSLTFTKVENGSSTLTLSIKYKDLDDHGLKLSEAELIMVVTTEGVARKDYWNMTSASLTLTGTLNGTTLPASSDVTPKSGYTWAEPACTAPYAPCAPVGLSWTCGDQVLAPMSSVVKNLSLGADTVRVHLPGMVLQLGNSTEDLFPWDCEPLIPLSVWVSVLISLFLASLLMWGLYMLATLQTPSKFDDPKGPSIHVPTSE